MTDTTRADAQHLAAKLLAHKGKLSQDDIIGMAREAGFNVGRMESPLGVRPLVKHSGFDCAAEMHRFAALVAAKEREACALACEALERRKWESVAGSGGRIAYAGAMDCAKAIRARGGNV